MRCEGPGSQDVKMNVVKVNVFVVCTYVHCILLGE